MGQDANQKILADYNDVFADIMNVLLFDGKKVVNEEGLENSKDRSQYKADGKLHEQERDVSKFYREQELRIAFLGIEHQNEKDYFMPARVISYDGSCYRAQLLERKNRSGITAGDEKRLKKRRKLYPVVTLVLYFGTSHWNQGKSLYEILDMPEDFKPFVNDYKINIVEVS
ncbi:MAG: Rpn family recombination-promoting nuclease/putative transposase, partial [Lachnospiraceae bacterium]|nr:Rpn family recombination-promoting nuclease/putative transposase [Lachnospiraceae bacterium]